MDESEARAALELMQSSRHRLARRARWSFVRHAAFGLLMGGLIASFALPDRFKLVALAICFAFTALIVWRDRRRDGFFVSGYRTGRTLPLTLIMLALVLAGLALAILLRTRFELVWAPVALGGVIAILATGTSMLWERIYRRELEADGRGA